MNLNLIKTATEEDLDSYTEKQAPKNTNYSTTWAVRNFLDWIKQRNLCFPTVPVPEALLTSGTAEQLDRWLSFYVLVLTAIKEKAALEQSRTMTCVSNCNVHVYRAPVNYVELQPSIQPPQTVAVNAELDSLLDFVAEDVLPF